MNISFFQKTKLPGLYLLCAMIVFGLISNAAMAENDLLKRGLEIVTKSGSDKGAGDLTVGEIGDAFKEALRMGSEKVVNQLGQQDGFNTDEAIHIPLPEKFKMVKSTLDKVGMSSLTDDLELKLNRAAEAATPKAKDLFFQAITDMSFDDAMEIYNGPKNSATTYFKDKMSASLGKEMAPIIDNSLAEVGAVAAYDKVMDKYKSIPFVPDVKANLTDYVIEKGMDGIFMYMAKEETAIRENPAKQTTELLKKVFGAK